MVILEGDQLHHLARIIHNQEVEAIHDVKFDSESELAKYLQISKDNFNSITRLLNDGKETMEMFQTNKTLSSIAHDIYSYIQNSMNFGIQSIRNYTLRSNYLTKIKAHADEIIGKLKDPMIEKDVGKVEGLAEEASKFRNDTLEGIRMRQTPISRNFSIWLKESGTSFPNLITRYQRICGFFGSFDKLRDEDKIEVYGKIIEASGRGNGFMNKLSKVSGAAGTVVLIFIAAMMVWDIFSSEHIIQTTTRDAVTAIAAVGGAMIGEVVGAALPSLCGIEASALFVMGSAIVGSIAGVFVIGSFVGWLIDLIFDSGDSVHFDTDKHRCYVTPLPDGETLARQIAHQHQLTI